MLPHRNIKNSGLLASERWNNLLGISPNGIIIVISIKSLL